MNLMQVPLPSKTKNLGPRRQRLIDRLSSTPGEWVYTRELGIAVYGEYNHRIHRRLVVLISLLNTSNPRFEIESKHPGRSGKQTAYRLVREDNTPAEEYQTRTQQFVEVIQTSEVSVADIQLVARRIYGACTPKEIHRVRSIAIRYAISGRYPRIKTHKFRGVIVGYSLRKEVIEEETTRIGVGHKRSSPGSKNHQATDRKNTSAPAQRIEHPDLVAGGAK